MTSILLTSFIGIPARATCGGETSAPAPVPIRSRNTPSPRRYGRTRIATASLHLPMASLLSLLLCATASAIPVDKIPDPRPASAVVDMTGTLLLTDKAAIDAEATRGSTGGALVVVVVGSVDGDTPRAYATRLFNRWQLDSRNRNKEQDGAPDRT